MVGNLVGNNDSNSCLWNLPALPKSQKKTPKPNHYSHSWAHSSSLSPPSNYPQSLAAVHHPTGSGLAAVVFGPAIASVLSMIALIFQATLLAHGGITTLGANVVLHGHRGTNGSLCHLDYLQKS